MFSGSRVAGRPWRSPPWMDDFDLGYDAVDSMLGVDVTDRCYAGIGR